MVVGVEHSIEKHFPPVVVVVVVVLVVILFPFTKKAWAEKKKRGSLKIF